MNNGLSFIQLLGLAERNTPVDSLAALYLYKLYEKLRENIRISAESIADADIVC